MNILKQWLLNCGYAPWDIDKWCDCTHDDIVDNYVYTDYIDKDHKLEPFDKSKISESYMCKVCGCPADVLNKTNFVNR